MNSHAEEPNEQIGEKVHYVKPALIVYGDLRALTQNAGKAGNFDAGGKGANDRTH